MTVFPGVAEVHVWAAHLEEIDFDSGLLSWLSQDERDRAARFRFERDKRRYERRRSLLRLLLGRYLGIEPASVRFRYGPQGKPELAESAGLQFNLSHSDGHVLFAFAQTQVGVDLERIRADIDVDSVARAVFAPEEMRHLGALPPGERVDAFYRCWTRREAYVKARGQGLSLPLDRIETTGWVFFDVAVFAGFAACVAARCGAGISACRRLSAGADLLA